LTKRFFSRIFWITLFFKQNKYHKYGVLLHTLKVCYKVLKDGNYKYFNVALFHDIGKPFVAYKKDDEDVIYNEYSFTDHEEKSYQIIKNWFFISSYTKKIVRYHYLIRDIKKSKKEDLTRYIQKKALWDTLEDDIKEDLATFLIYDDLAKGKRRR